MKLKLAGLVAWTVCAGTTPAFALPAGPDVRPSKILGVEHATTVPNGATLFGFNGGALGVRRGLSDDLELVADLNSLSVLPTLGLGLDLGLKDTLWDGGHFAVGVEGLAAATYQAQAWAPGAMVSLPLSFVPSKILRVNLQPHLSYTGSAVFGADLGLGYHFVPGVWEFIGQLGVADVTLAQPSGAAGVEYFGFGPKTTVGMKLLTVAGAPGFAYAATLYQAL